MIRINKILSEPTYFDTLDELFFEKYLMCSS